MKFYCDKCQAKYSIADEKVRGKVLKVRCKKCSHVITVREPRAPVGAGPRQPQQQTTPQSLPWYYALNGQTFGPYEKQALMRMFESGEIGDACYIWNETFVEWLPARRVPEFVPALDRGSAIRPRNKTIGVSGALEAIKVEQVDALRQPSLEQEISQVEEEEAEEEGAVPGQMAERIDALRDRLKQHQRAPEGAQKNPFGKKEVKAPSPLVTPLAQNKPSLSLPTRKDEPRKDEPTAPPLAIKNAPVSQENEDATSQMSVAEISGLLDAPSSGLGGGSTEAVEDLNVETSQASPEEEPAAAPAITSDIFSGLDTDAGDYLSDETREEIPAFIGATPMPESTLDFSKLEARERDNDQLFVNAPNLPAPGGGDDRFQASNSLLIQMDSIQKQGRGKRVTMIAGLVILFSVLGVVAVIAAQNSRKNVQPEKKPSMVWDDGKKEITFNTYSQEERAGLYHLDGEEVITADEPGAILNDETIEENEPASNSKATAPNKVIARNDVGQKPASSTSPNIRGIKDLLNDSSSRDDALEGSRRGQVGSRSGLDTSSDDGPRKIQVDGARTNSSAKKEWAAPAVGTGGSRRPGIRGPSSSTTDTSSDKPKTAKLGEGGALSPADARKGFRKISRSVQTCHQRQVTRGLPVDAPKVFLTARIENDGSVSSIKIEPSSLESSEFASCLQSHRRAGRWTFAEFEGKPLDIRHTYVLQ